MSTELPQEERNKEVPVVASDRLFEAFDSATRKFPVQRNVMESVDLIQAILDGNGNAAKILEVASYGNEDKFKQSLRKEINSPVITSEQAGKLKFNGKETPYSQSLANLVINAQLIAGQGNQITTTHILLAEISRQDSIINNALRQSGIEDPLPDLILEIKNTKEEKGMQDEFGRRVIPGLQVDLSTSLNSSDKQEEIKPGFINMSDKANRGEYTNEVFYPQWVRETARYAADDEVKVIVLNTDREETSLVLKGLSVALSEGRGQSIGIENIIGIDESSLETNQDITLTKAIQAVQNGILYLPHLERYSSNRLLQKALNEGKIKKIVTNFTKDEWVKSRDQYLFSNAKYLELDQPDIKKVTEILQAQKDNLEKQFSNKNGSYNIKVTNEAIDEAAKIAQKYFKDTYSLSGALQILRHAASNLKLESIGSALVTSGNTENDNQIDVNDVWTALYELKGIDIGVEDQSKFLHMEDRLSAEIIGQPEAIMIVSDAIRRSKAELGDPKKPIGSFIFVGPSGVGKTELAKALAKFLFGSEEMLKQFDMSQFKGKHDAARLYGAPPGYVGYEAGGELTEGIRRDPYSVVLFDEIEKADREVADPLLQVTEEGKLTDGQGRIAYFNQSVVILTTNVGSDEFAALIPLYEKYNKHEITQEQFDKAQKEIDQRVMDRIHNPEEFRPEFLNRIDAIIIFHPLNKDQLFTIAGLQLDKLGKRLQDKGINYTYSDEVRHKLVDESFNPEFGARPLVRTINKDIADDLSKAILAGDLHSGDTVNISMAGNKYSIITSKKSIT